MALQVFDPTTEAKNSPWPLPRPESLRNSALVWLRIRSTTRTGCCSGLLFWRRSMVPRAILRSKRGLGYRHTKEIIDEYTVNCDVVIAGVGDWIVQLGQCARRRYPV